MGAYHYIALNADGKREKGVSEAESARQVREQLREKGLMPLEVTAVGSDKKLAKGERAKPQRKRLSSADLALLTRQMSTLLAASMPVDEVLTALAEQTEKPHVKGIILGVRARVLEGHSLAAGMDAFPRAFPALYRTTIAAGEKSGQVDRVLDKLADYTERQHEIRQKIIQAMAYPALMTLVSIGVVVFMLLYVVPKIVSAFAQTKQTLPLPTTILIGTSDFLPHY